MVVQEVEGFELVLADLGPFGRWFPPCDEPFCRWAPANPFMWKVI
jgi:hypothetical protein